MAKGAERRAEARVEVDQFYSVELSVSGAEFLYQFKIWNLSDHGVCVVVRDDSDLLNHLKVGNILEMKYCPVDLSDATVQLKTEIKHITKQEEGRFKGHTLVGLFILEKETSDTQNNS
jgi:hypothetical protein